ncbi:MAG: dihydrofolate reductase family protein [Acidimicrobiales bacterium]
MRQLLPSMVGSADPLDLLAADTRQPVGLRPWVMTNMISSIDGAYVVEGRSGGLAGPGDHQVFHALRTLADVILVAAGTARTERYRRPSVVESGREARERLGLAPAPRLAIVSRRLEFDDDLPFLTGSGADPILFHPDDADTSGVPPGLELRPAGHGSVDLGVAIESLARDGAHVVLCEGGPTLLGQLHLDDLIDEYFLTVAPMGVGGPWTGLFGSAPDEVRRYDLHRVLEDDDFLMLTYRRKRVGPT